MIDCHIHRYPPEVIKDPSGWALLMGEAHWGRLVAPSKGFSLQGWADRRRLFEDMDRAGIEKVVMLGWYWECQATCELQNRWHLDWLKEDPGRLLAFAAVQPGEGDQAFDAVRRAIDGGCRGIGEMMPVVQGFARNHPTWLKILQWAQENGIPVNMHVTDPVGHEYAGKIETPLSDFQWIARQFPDLKLILSHWGGGLPFYELNKSQREDFKNVYYDTAAGPLLYEPDIWRRVCDLVGPDKILFGSDYPLLLYPGKSKETGFTLLLDEARQSGLTEEELEKILSANARKLFGLDKQSTD